MELRLLVSKNKKTKPPGGCEEFGVFFFFFGGFGRPCHVTAHALEGFHKKSSGVLVEMTVTQSSTPCSSAQGKWHSGNS